MMNKRGTPKVDYKICLRYWELPMTVTSMCGRKNLGCDGIQGPRCPTFDRTVGTANRHLMGNDRSERVLGSMGMGAQT